MNQWTNADRRGKPILFSKNSMIQTPDEAKKGAFIIQKGLLRLFRLHEDGKAFTLGMLGPGDVFGELGGISLGPSKVYIEVVQDAAITYWEEQLALEQLTASSPLVQQMMSQLSGRLHEQEERLEKLATRPVRDRVIHVLLQLCKRFGKEEGDYFKLDIPLSHQDIANMVGATRETVSLALGQLVFEQVLRKSRMRFALHRTLVNESRERSHALWPRWVNILSSGKSEKGV